jgi:hypothetical protein
MAVTVQCFYSAPGPVVPSKRPPPAPSVPAPPPPKKASPSVHKEQRRRWACCFVERADKKGRHDGGRVHGKLWTGRRARLDRSRQRVQWYLHWARDTRQRAVTAWSTFPGQCSLNDKFLSQRIHSHYCFSLEYLATFFLHSFYSENLVVTVYIITYLFVLYIGYFCIYCTVGQKKRQSLTC